MIFSALNWIQIITVISLAIVAKEYLNIRMVLQEAKRTGICEVKECEHSIESASDELPPGNSKLKKIYEQQRANIMRTSTKDAEGKHMTVADVIQSHGSSVWCTGSDHNDRLCHFRNLCYLPQQKIYAFFHGAKSVLSGVPEDRNTPALLDMSTVRHHNRYVFTYVDVPVTEAPNVLQNAILVNATSLIFKRFNPDNLMHVFHDDLLPAFYTMLELQSPFGKDGSVKMKAFDIQLVMMEGWKPGQHSELYQLMSSYQQIYLAEINRAGIPVCFHDAHVGISKFTTWYHYGFHEPQGPMPEIQVTGKEVRYFADYIRDRCDIDVAGPTKLNSVNAEFKVSHGDTIVLFTRKHNRLILNELELVTAMARELTMKVVTLSTENNSVQHMISVVSHAAVVVGMHGSILSFAMFLPMGAVLVELFPYAVNPQHYTPYKILAELPGMGVLYKSWRNMDAKSSVIHPDSPPDIGGIAHLSAADQQRIMASTEVPRHLCCKDPEWLFRIYQDTLVDTKTIVNLIKHALMERDVKYETFESESAALVLDNISPSEVRDLKCRGSGDEDVQSQGDRAPNMHVFWQPPWNVEYIDDVKVEYEVWIQEIGKKDYSAFVMTKTEHVFDSGFQRGVQYNIWVRCVFDGEVQGPFNSDQVACRP